MLLTLSTVVMAGKRFVSKNGSSIPPYTSWETAADSIMKAMNISIPGDTIIVGEGIFCEFVRFNEGIVLIGAGWDLTTIKLPNLTTGAELIVMRDKCEISNLVLRGDGQEEYIRGVTTFRSANGLLAVSIKHLKIVDFFGGISLGGFYNPAEDTSYIQNVVIDSCVEGISVEMNTVVITNNFITTSESNLYTNIGSRCDVHNNVFVVSPYFNTFTPGFVNIKEGFSGPASIRNNLIVSTYRDNIDPFSWGIEAGPDTVSNNLLTGNFGVAVRTNGSSSLRDIFNNHISGGLFYGFYGNASLRFNNFQNNGVHFHSDNGSTIDTISNITRYPMFVAEEKDFHLQLFSPLINAGDTLVKDRDGTRSDIGMYGGRDGKSYTYLDLAPLEPRGIAATVAGDTIRLDWKKNQESDFKQYLVFGDTTQGFSADSSRLIGRLTDTSFTKIIPGLSGGYFIRLRSEDNQGNISEESEEIRIIPVGINGEGHEVVQDYRLFNNYPNPFNPETVIGYRLKSPGRVILTVYTITGEPVRVLQDGEMPAGYHETRFRGDDLASGIYLYKIDVRSPEGVPVYTSVRKMLLLK